MKTAVFFNNKGGVGKTTLTCNVVAYLNIVLGKRVLLIDADPQCNATQSILTEEQCEEIYFSKRNTTKTLFDYLSAIEAGEASVTLPIETMLGTKNKFSTDLIPCHPKVAIVEDKLSAAWNGVNAGTPAGYRITNWCSQLFQDIEGRYDLVIFDVGPSLGALNRTVILSCDYLITPFGCDIFSILGIQNISTWIKDWRKQYERAIKNVQEDRPEFLNQYPIITEPDKKSLFIGYSVQQYVTKTVEAGVKRPVKAYERIMEEIPTAVYDALDFLKKPGLTKENMELGHIPYLYSLVPLAQSERMPIHQLKNSNRLIGNQGKQVDAYSETMAFLCERLLSNMGLQ